MTPPAYSIRAATPADAETITHHRAAMFRDMAHRTEAERAEMSTRFLPWVRAQLEAGTYLGFLAVTPGAGGEQITAGAGLRFIDWPPSPGFPDAQRAHLLNVFTEPAHRQQGLARLLVQRCLDECRAHGVHNVGLHASDQGRPVYAALGFQGTNEMRLVLKSD